MGSELEGGGVSAVKVTHCPFQDEISPRREHRRGSSYDLVGWDADAVHDLTIGPAHESG